MSLYDDEDFNVYRDVDREAREDRYLSAADHEPRELRNPYTGDWMDVPRRRSVELDER